MKDSASHGLGKAKSAAFAAVPNIITEGRIIDSQTNWKGRGYDSVTIAAPIRIGNENYVGVVVVKKSKEFNRFYLHEVMIQKSLRDGVFQTSLNAGNPSGDIAKVIKNIINANNSSKIIDANGEPKVAEHSTWNEDFYTFDISRIPSANLKHSFRPQARRWQRVRQHKTRRHETLKKILTLSPKRSRISLLRH